MNVLVYGFTDPGWYTSTATLISGTILVRPVRLPENFQPCEKQGNRQARRKWIRENGCSDMRYFHNRACMQAWYIHLSKLWAECGIVHMKFSEH